MQVMKLGCSLAHARCSKRKWRSVRPPAGLFASRVAPSKPTATFTGIWPTKIGASAQSRTDQGTQDMEQIFGWLPLWVAAIVSLVLLPVLIIAHRMTVKRLTKAEHMIGFASGLIGGYGVLSVFTQAAGITT